MEDHNEVWYYFRESAKSSLVFGGLLSLAMKSLLPVVGSAATIIYYRNLYKSALDKASMNGMKSAIENKGLDKVIEDTALNGSVEEIKNLFKYLDIK